MTEPRPAAPTRVVEYVGLDGRSPFGRWFDDLEPEAAAKVATIVARLELGHQGGLKSLGGGVSEWRIDTGPGYRVYLAQAGEGAIVLLGGGTKRRQDDDISAARACWLDYKRREEGDE